MEVQKPAGKKGEMIKRPVTVVYCNLCGQKLRIKSRNYSGLERHLFNSSHRDTYTMAKEQHGVVSETSVSVKRGKRDGSQSLESGSKRKKQSSSSVDPKVTTEKDRFESMVSKLDSIRSLGELLQELIEKNSTDETQKGLVKCIVEKSSVTPETYQALSTTATCIRSFVSPLQDLIQSGDKEQNKSQVALLKSISNLTESMNEVTVYSV
jgi:hypothetical protein